MHIHNAFIWLKKDLEEQDLAGFRYQDDRRRGSLRAGCFFQRPRVYHIALPAAGQ